MTSIALAPSRSASISEELDRARRRGPLNQLVIPPCPALLMRLQEVMAEPEPDLNEVARIATSDVAMAATLLRAANSPLHAAGQPVQTLGQAMNRLGLDETAAVMTGFLLKGAIRVDNPHLQGFWERAAKNALAMAYIARQLPGMSPDLGHTFGLFCHVGFPVLLQSMKGYGGTLVEARARTDRSFVATENANHKTDHAVVGALVARLWRLSPEVVAAIRLHHDLDVIGEDVEPGVSTLLAAGLVAQHLTMRHEGLADEADWTCHGADALHWLQVGADELTTWQDQLFPLLDAA
jgi:HD-like signal output (HDOD) protein